jgi:putative transposase
MTFIRSYCVKHNMNLEGQLKAAFRVAQFAVQNKHNKKKLSSKYVKHFGLPSTISCQILRKYGRGNIKEPTNVNLIIPNSSKREYKMKDGTTKEYRNIVYEKEYVMLKPLRLQFRWNPGRNFLHINQVEILSNRFVISATFEDVVPIKCEGVLGIDLNCGVGRDVANCANLQNGEILNFGVQGPNIRKRYFLKRKKHLVVGDGEKKKMRDLDHKISDRIVNYALQHKLKIVVEDLKGIRSTCRKGNGSRVANRFVNSWSFYRLQRFIEYKAKERGIVFLKVKPHYTSQECSFCGIIGTRDKESFYCNNRKCEAFPRKLNSDINAAFNIAKRGAHESSTIQMVKNSSQEPIT